MRICSTCGNLGEFYTEKDYRCKICHRRKVAEWRKKNPEKHRAAAKKYALENKEKVREYIKAWVDRNRKRVNRLNAEWRSRNQEKAKEMVRNWNARNRSVERARVRERQATKLKATPKWSIKFFVQEAYHLAELRNKATGFEWHVDHIVPIKSDIVCGLHAHTNIQVIPAKQNMSKGNYRWPDMP